MLFRSVIADPVVYLFGVSPDGRWAMVWASGPGEISDAVMAYPLDGGPARLVCNHCGTTGGPEVGRAAPIAGWSPDGRFFYIQSAREGLIPMNVRHVSDTFVVPLAPGQVLPALPAAGIQSEADLISWKGRRVIPTDVFLGPDPNVYLYVRTSTQRNLYRIQIPPE